MRRRGVPEDWRRWHDEDASDVQVVIGGRGSYGPAPSIEALIASHERRMMSVDEAVDALGRRGLYTTFRSIETISVRDGLV